ncbi:MAG TPA: protein kinase [Nitrolancea sp.]
MQSRTLNGRYRLDQLIGEGGMAVVYRGYDLVLGRVVAIKLLREQFGSDQNFLLRFNREAQSAARLTHPNIANVYDVGHDRDTHYIVMEFVNGPNLKDLIRRQGPFSVEGAAFILRQVADALDAAHRHGLVHRDVKPQNILVDENGQAKVVDFGIAKGLSDSNLTEAGTGMGTVHYVSPEQARGERATPASDIYSTGIVLYEMLTKQLPFDADTPVGVAMQHVSAVPPSPREFNPSIPPQVEDIVMRALAKDPDDRYPTASALAAALDHWEEAPNEVQSTRVLAGAAGGATRGVRPRGVAAAGGYGAGRGGARTATRPHPREQPFRDDVGCVTWLIGSAILIGLVGLVVLGFKLGDFSFLDPSGAGTATSTAQVSTPAPSASVPIVVKSPTATPTQTTPSPTANATPTGTGTPSASPTATETPSPTPTETPSPTPSATATAATANVPNLNNSTLEQAQTAALPGEFKINAQYAYSDVFPPNKIFNQDPQPATQAPRGSTINVTISLGPQFVTIPNLTGKPVGQAKGQLEDMGLKVTVVEQGSKTVPAGAVIGTDPSGQVQNGSAVTLYASVGDQVQVPDVSKMPYQQGISKLESAGLSVTSATPQTCAQIQAQDSTFNCSTYPNGGIVSGTLQWNSWVPRGSSIDIAYYNASAP